MKFPLVSRRRYQRDLAHQERGWQIAFQRATTNNRDALAQVATELSTLKDEVALHIVAAEHPSSALSDARSMALSLREALEAHGVDLRLELDRLNRGPL